MNERRRRELKRIRYHFRKKKVFQPCFGFFLQGSVKQIAIANSFVAVASMVIFAVGIGEYVPRYNDPPKFQQDIRPAFWLYYYVYWSAEIYLALILHTATCKRDGETCKKWLLFEKIGYCIWIVLFMGHMFWLQGFNMILEAVFSVAAVYKLYAFWVVSCFIAEIECNGSFNKLVLTKLTDQDLEEFANGLVGTERRDSAPDTHAYDKNLELEMSNFNDRSEWSKIGEGEFGVVYKALMTRSGSGIGPVPLLVAVKTIDPQMTDAAQFKTLLTELKIRAYIGQHENIVNLIGACTTHIKERKLDLVVELCLFGNLEAFLAARTGLFINQIDAEGKLHLCTLEYNTYNSLSSLPILSSFESVKTTDLIRWSIHIARGMEYLHSKKVLHGDLAARNVLLSADKVAKINDFGLSRRIYSYRSYVKSKQKLLPWRWMSPESFGKHLIFSLESDIWAFGVTLYEIFSLGGVPYALRDLDDDFVRELKNGLTLPRPDFAPVQVYEVMQNCMKLDPKARWTFDKIIEKLTTILNDFRIHCDRQEILGAITAISTSDSAKIDVRENSMNAPVPSSLTVDLIKVTRPYCNRLELENQTMQ